MIALRNKGTSNASQARELQKLKRQDLLELLLEQMRENDNLSLELERRRVALEGLDATLERLKAKLDLKDAQIERLKGRLDDKDLQVARFKAKLNDKDAQIERLKGRLDHKDRMIAGLMGRDHGVSIDPALMEELLTAEEFALEAMWAVQHEGEAAHETSNAATAPEAAAVLATETVPENANETEAATVSRVDPMSGKAFEPKTMSGAQPMARRAATARITVGEEASDGR